MPSGPSVPESWPPWPGSIDDAADLQPERADHGTAAVGGRLGFVNGRGSADQWCQCCPRSCCVLRYESARAWLAQDPAAMPEWCRRPKRRSARLWDGWSPSRGRAGGSSAAISCVAAGIAGRRRLICNRSCGSWIVVVGDGRARLKAAGAVARHAASAQMRRQWRLPDDCVWRLGELLSWLRLPGFASVNIDDQPIRIWQQERRVVAHIADIEDDPGHVVGKLRDRGCA